MNLMLRLKNKVTLAAIITMVLAIAYTALGLFGIVPSVTESQARDLALMAVELLVALGVVVDPTTAGISDSARAMGYEKPWEDDDDAS